MQVWRFDPWEYNWLQVASMNDARESFQMATLDFKLYVVGKSTIQVLVKYLIKYIILKLNLGLYFKIMV